MVLVNKLIAIITVAWLVKKVGLNLDLNGTNKLPVTLLNFC